MHKARVLILSSCINGGGAGRSLQAFLKFAGLEIEAHLVQPEPGIIVDQLQHVRRFWYVPEFVERIHRAPYGWVRRLDWRWLHLVANWYAILRAVYKIIQIAREVKPELLYCNHMLAKPVGAVVGAWLKIPVVFHVRNVHVHWFGKRFYQFLGRRACVTRIICNSETSAAPFLQSSPEKVVVVHNFVDLHGFSRGQFPARLREEFGISSDTPVVGYLGRLVPKKGIDVLLKAFKIVVQTYPRAILALVGGNDGGYTRDLQGLYRQMAQDLGIEKNIVFTGFQKDIRPYLADFDILALPSVEPESFGRSLIEAMALQIPCIATAHGGAVEVVKHGENGLWASPGDETELAQAIETLLSDSHLRTRMGSVGERFVRENYDAQFLSIKIATLLNEVIPFRPSRNKMLALGLSVSLLLPIPSYASTHGRDYVMGTSGAISVTLLAALIYQAVRPKKKEEIPKPEPNPTPSPSTPLLPNLNAQ